jgi:hypothetical protein
MPIPKIEMARTNTKEKHALRSHDISVHIPEAGAWHLKWIVACKCGWLDDILRSSSDLRDAYRQHKREAK